MPPLPRTSRVRISGSQRHGSVKRRHRSSAAHARARARRWSDVLDAPRALHGQQIVVVGVALVFGWASLAAAAIAALG